MIALRITGRAGPAQTGPRGHHATIKPLSHRPPERRPRMRCGECPACTSDMANLVPCMRAPK